MEENDAECGKCGKRLNHYNTGEVGEQAICHPCQTGLVGEIPKRLGDLADGVDKQQINTLAQMWMDSRSVGWLNRGRPRGGNNGREPGNGYTLNKPRAALEASCYLHRDKVFPCNGLRRALHCVEAVSYT